MDEKNNHTRECGQGLDVPLLFALIFIVLLSLLHMVAPTLMVFGMMTAFSAKVGLGLALLAFVIMVTSIAGVLGLLAAAFSIGMIIVFGVVLLIPLLIFSPLLILASPALLLLGLVLWIFRHGHKRRTHH